MADNAFYTEPGSGRVIAFRDDGAASHQRCDMEGIVAHDAAASTVLPMLVGGFASAAAPSDVSLDTDSVRSWHLRNGAGVVAISAAGVLLTATSNSLNVNVTNMLTVFSHAVTNAGTFVVQETGTALTALQLIDDAIFADEGAFTLATSKVMAMGLHSVAHGSNPDVTAADLAVNPICNRHRVPFVIGGHPNIVTIKHANITTAVTDIAIITVGAALKIVVTGIIVTLDNASTVFPTVLIGFGTATTPTTTGVIASHGGVPAGGGFNRGDGTGILGIGADNEDLRITTTGNATGNGLQVVVTYYTIES